MNCLERINTTRDEIRMALISNGVTRPESKPMIRDKHYVCGDQHKVWARVRQSEPSFFALALMGYNGATIGAVTGVSGECVLRRLRVVGLAKRGRPRIN